MPSFDFLPPLMCRADYGSENEYINALYDVFSRDFLETERTFDGLPIRIKRHPPYDGVFIDKEATFRHLITAGYNEADRNIDIKRCERIGWILSLIENSSLPQVHIWENRRSTNGRAHILSLSNFSYKVVLTQRSDYLLLWTQFPVTYGHERDKLRRDYERS